MKMSNAELIGFFAALGALRMRGMPARLAWKLSVNEKILKPFADAFDASAEELRKRFAEKDESGAIVTKDTPNGPTYQIPEESLDAANLELQELLKEQFDVTPVEIGLADFPDTFEVTPETMTLLVPIMETTSQSKKK